VWTQLAYAVTIRKRVSATCFFPVPRVRSAVVQMVRRGDGIGAPHRAAYYALSRHAFARRRKQMATALSHPGPLAPPLSKEKAVRGLRAAGLDPRIRAEALEVADWLRLAAWYAAEGGGRGAVPREG
jgi:16S rRNA (adenine1518-N6/adenine1519-N6)-dimethyltransferase